MKPLGCQRSDISVMNMGHVNQLTKNSSPSPITSTYRSTTYAAEAITRKGGNYAMSSLRRIRIRLYRGMLRLSGTSLSV